MDVIQSMTVFVRVAQRAGFAAAARDLRMSPAAVTKHVAALESRLGARLFDRTTRSVALTEPGRVYLERSLECLNAFEDAEASVSQLSKTPGGTLRVTAPVDFERELSSVVTRFMNDQPGVMVDLRLSNRAVDLVEEGVDVAVRLARSLDGSYVAVKLATVRMAVFAAPSYLRKHGRPERPEDLAHHKNIVFVEPRPYDQLDFVRGKERTTVKLAAAMTTNSGHVVRAALLDGIGIAAAPSFVVHADLRTGALEPLLPGWTLTTEPRLFAIYPHRRFLSPKVRAFVDALRAAYGDGEGDPWWPATPATPATPALPALPAQRRAANIARKTSRAR